MKTLFLGDIHGRSIWKLIVEREKPDKVVFIGDYFDSFDVPGLEQMHNFKEIVAYKESGKSEVVLLVGNHDYHYMDVEDEGNCSGYQPNLSFDIKFLLKENMRHLQMAHVHEGWLCTHAGVTNTFCKYRDLDTNNIESDLNELFKYQPDSFGFDGWDGYGDDVTQGPLWVRPRSLRKDAIDHKQIVGHTRNMNLTHPEDPDKQIYFIDCFDNDRMQYLKMENGQMIISEV